MTVGHVPNETLEFVANKIAEHLLQVAWYRSGVVRILSQGEARNQAEITEI